MATESWRLCATWLVQCGVLPYDHRIMNDDAEVFDLGQTLRDGVILCHLLNHMKPGSIDTLELSNIRSQTSQFLCMKNIRTFLRACSRVFKIREADFFDPAWLFQMSNFGSLIDLLSKLSHTEDAIHTGAQPFKTEQEDIYGGLEDLADEHDLANEGDIYDTVDEDEGDKIYDDLVNIRRELTLNSHRPTSTRPSSSEGPEDPFGHLNSCLGGPAGHLKKKLRPKTAKRDFCKTEIMETEGKYVEALSMLCEQFIKPLKRILDRGDIDKIFLNIEELLRRHRGFQRDLNDAFHRSNPTMAQAFKKHKPDFLIYGFYCAHMLSAQNHIEKVSSNPTVRQKIEDCERRANDRKFRLRDLLSVPMQRILKYHLLIKELVKSTDKTHPERKELDEALDEMQDVSMFVNEVKRDHELMQTNEAIQASLVGYRGESLNTYGRNQKDGELKIRITGAGSKKSAAQTRYCFLFDKVMLVCKSGGRLNVEKLWGQESHEYNNTIDLAQYNVENNLPSGRSGRPETGKRNARWTDMETVVLSQFVKANRTKLFGKAGHCSDKVEARKRKYWQKGADFLAKECGGKRMWDEVRKKWADSKVRANNYEKLKKRTGGGPEPKVKPALEAVLEAVLEAIAPQSRHGVVGKETEMGCSQSSASSEWNFCFHLTAKDQSGARSNIEVYCKTEEMMQRWVEGIRLAQDNIQPRINNKGHTVEYTSFQENMTCESCHKLLRGLFFQGYKCTTCNISVHKECISSNHTSYCNQQGNGGRPPSTPAGQQLKVTRPYKGVPIPLPGEQPLVVNAGAQVLVLENIGSDWKRVKMMNAPNAIGLVPSSHLMENYEQTHVLPRAPTSQRSDSQVVPAVSGLFAYPWFVGEMERGEANDKLMVKPGCFLLRKSKRGGYAVSLEHDKVVKHMRVVVENNHFGLAEQTTFPSLQEMITYYSTNSLVSVFRGLDAYLRKPYRGGTMPCAGENGSRNKRYNVIGQAKAMYDFSARDTRELTLRENEMVAIISKAGGHRGWWKGCIGDRVGYFPSTYVEEIDNGAPS